MRLHEGLDYLLYRIFVWGGMAALVAWIVYASFNAEPRAAWFQTLLSLSLYLGGILGYWWWSFLFKKEETPAEPTDILALRNLKSWTTLHRAMTRHGGDLEAWQQTQKGSKTPMLLWYGVANLLVIWILGFMWLSHYRLVSDEDFYLLPSGVVVITIGMTVFIPFFLSWGSRASETAYLAPLGLALAETPSPQFNPLALFGGQTIIPAGATVITGQRYGRSIQIQVIDKQSITRVQANVVPFCLQSQNGKLIATEDSSPQILPALKGLRKAKRWRGITVSGDREGITVERTSPGRNMWLYDLWLVEMLLAKMDAG